MTIDREDMLEIVRRRIDTRLKRAEVDYIKLLAFVGTKAYRDQGPVERARINRRADLQARYVDALVDLLSIPWVAERPAAPATADAGAAHPRKPIDTGGCYEGDTVGYLAG